MEKFAVDLEKVLDEFEFSEEREERVALSVINSQSLPYISHVTQPRPPVNNYRRPSFEPINLADADFAVSSPCVPQQHHNQRNLTYNNSSIANTLQSNTNDNKSTSTDKLHRQFSDERLLSNGLTLPKNTSEILIKPNSLPASNINNTLTTAASIPFNSVTSVLSSRDSVISESLSEEETSSLSDDKPDLLDYGGTNKFIKFNEQKRRSDRREETEIGRDDEEEDTGRLLPDVTSSVLPVKCISNQNSLDDYSLNSSNPSNNSCAFDLISSSSSVGVKNNNDGVNLQTNYSESHDNEVIDSLSADLGIDTEQKDLNIKSSEQFLDKELVDENFESTANEDRRITFSSVENQKLFLVPSEDENKDKLPYEDKEDFISDADSKVEKSLKKEDFSSKFDCTNLASVDKVEVTEISVDKTNANSKNSAGSSVIDFNEEPVTINLNDKSTHEPHLSDLNERTLAETDDHASGIVSPSHIQTVVCSQPIGFTLDHESSDDNEELEKYLEELEELEKSQEEIKCDDNIVVEKIDADDIDNTRPESLFLQSAVIEKIESPVDIECSVGEVKLISNVDGKDDRKLKYCEHYVESDVSGNFEEKSNEDVSFKDCNNESVIVVKNIEDLTDYDKSNSVNELKENCDEAIKLDAPVIDSSDEISDDTDDSISRINSFMKDSDCNFLTSNDYSCKISENSNCVNSVIINSNLVAEGNEVETDSKRNISNESECTNRHALSPFEDKGITSIETVNTMGNSVDKSTSLLDNSRSDVVAQNSEEIANASLNCSDSANKTEQDLSSDDLRSSAEGIVEDSDVLRVSRPNYLDLPDKITVDAEANNDEAATPSSSTSPSSATTITSADGVEVGNNGGSPISCGELSSEECQLGKVPPFWIPDKDAATCMQCDEKFTFVKRRHHCRACGQVLCSKCCSMRTKLNFMVGEARVCQPCYNIIGKGNFSENKSPLGRQPNPNNPMEYCSTIPPLQQAAGSLHQPPPSVLVPVGVLKREGRVKSEVAKQVMFSDGIRPGGDLTELDGSGEPRLPFRRPGRLTKRVGTPPGGGAVGSGRRTLDPITESFIPANTEGKNGSSLPPIVERIQGENVYSQFDVVFSKGVKVDDEKPIKFAINANLFVLVKRVVLDCCVNRECWCITSSGLACVGQDEVILVLECLPDEVSPPRDVFLLINTLYIDASKGNTVSELSFSPSFSTNLLDSRDHGGFLYIRPSYQCTSKLILPSPPYLVALLIHKWETPWARLFPIRLVLRLGAEYRYYPCPLVSIRHRPPLYTDIGHTIINMLADFRKYSYTLSTVRGLVVHMEDRQTTILLPRNRYDQVIRALNNSNDSVLAFGANLSLAADSHLVCIQSANDENTYHTQAINIHSKPRRVTGASFVVFSGALQASFGLSGKSSIVEDGLMVQVPSDTMTALRTALRDMRDYTIRCGPHAEETVLLRWTADDTNFNIGVKSCIDGRLLDGVPSMRVHNGTDYSGQFRIIRWTEVFILQCEEVEGSGDPLDISKLSESLARATCMALVPFLDLLAAANLTTIGVRAAIHPDHVGYEAGSNFEKLPPLYMNSLDNELVAVVHQAAMTCQDTPCTLELVFRVMES